MTTCPRTVGVEEELLLLDPDSLAVRAAASRVLSHGDGRGEDGGELDGDLDAELTREQVESGSAPRTSLALPRTSLSALRRTAAQAARAEGVALAATATSPTRGNPTVTPEPRYERMRSEFGLTAREQLRCGCHVHVAIESPEEAVGRMVDNLFARGTGADRQRSALRRRGRITDVVDLIVRETDPDSSDAVSATEPLLG